MQLKYKKKRSTRAVTEYFYICTFLTGKKPLSQSPYEKLSQNFNFGHFETLLSKKQKRETDLLFSRNKHDQL